MIDLIGETGAVALIGAFGGIMLGLAARLGRFCTLGAIEDILYGASDLRMRMWGVAIGVAILGTFGLVAGGWLDIGQTSYLSGGWTPVAHVIGGLVFGYGMALAGNCGFGALARLGGGDLRSFLIVLVMGLSAYITLSGPLARLRLWLFEPSAGTGARGYAAMIGDMIGLSPAGAGLLIGALILGGTIGTGKTWRAPDVLVWGTVVGLAIVSGWAGTYWIAMEGFEGTPVVSHTFSAPIGETMLYAMTASGNSLSFGIGSVVGVLVGAFIGSLIKGHFRWEACDDPRELRRQILGAALMGVGAVVAVGCSVGQGLSAFSVLAFGAPVTFVAMLVGAAIGLRQLIEGFESIS